VNRAIIDRGTILKDGMVIGEDAKEDRARGFRVTDSGLTLVTADMLGQQLHFTR
jgi:glucose-1-phosphate adenylyltransferase